ncbi:MAG: hypothetical protein ACK41C_16185 [Phenylobacterium sp.]|uniref:hypothetical protein n=1 Tax=Phenylobacterium sp. TaxID=1871053 RepID=UPI00391899E1
MPNRLVSDRILRVPPEVVNVAGTAAAIFAVVAAGAGIVSLLPDQASPWLVASAYGAPAGLAFLAYWWIAQKL